MGNWVIIILQGCIIPPLGKEPFDFLDIPYKKSVWAK